MKVALIFLLAIVVLNCSREAHGFHSIGCFKDKSDRDLPHLAHKGKDVTVPMCYKLCKNLKYPYFGLQISDHCFCGSSYGRYGPVKNSECQMKCSGDSATFCGGHWRNRVYSTGLHVTSHGFHLLGCFKDTADRDLPLLAFRGGLTLSSCYDLCRRRKYAYFAVQVSDSCFCGNSYGKHGTAPMSECNIECSNDKSTRCGGHWRNRVFTTGLTNYPHELQHIGCFKDKGERDLPFLALQGKVTVKLCNQLCRSHNYAYFGMQVSDFCFCGNTYGKYGEAHDGDCNIKCSGDANTLCGGHWRNRIFSTGVINS